MKDFVKRMIDEHKALGEKTAKAVTAVTATDAFEKLGAEQYACLMIQVHHMQGYYEALTNRLSLLGVEASEDGSYYNKID